MRRWLLIVLVSTLCVPALAQQYPTKPIRLVVAFAPGGASDLLARLLAARLADALGQTVVVDNRPAAGGIVGSDAVAKSAPDGHTLLVGSAAALAITPHLNVRLPYDTLKDFTPIAPFAGITFVLAVNPKVPVQSLRELIALAKSKPGTLNFGSAGNGTTTHMVGELFKSTAGVNLTHVPFKGAGPAMIALVSGQIQLLFDASITALPQLKAGRIRALAVGSAQRSDLFPDIPTFSEAGLAGFTAGNWFGVFAPARTPLAVAKRLNTEITKAMNQADVRSDFLTRGAEVMTASPESFRALVVSEYERYGKLVKAAKITID